jgi:acetyltransferase-like isoleucine patch superfamily enzyme
MRQTLSLVTKGQSWRIYSWITRMTSKLVYGIDFPGRPRFAGALSMNLVSTAEPSVVVGFDAQFLGDIDLRTRDSAILRFGDRVKLDGPVRIVAAGQRGIEIGDDTRITCYTIINGGGHIHIGKGVIIGPRSSINANEHRFRSNTPVIDSGFDHVDIWIGDDVWLGSDVAVLPGAHIANGTIIGANSVVNCATEPRSIYVGSPARRVGMRPD